MQLYNQTRETLVAQQLEVPRTTVARMRGLLGRSSLPAGHGMLFTGCGWVHTFFMQFAIDLIFLDSNNRVVALRQALAPNRLSPLIWRATSTVELPVNSIQSSQTSVGDQLVLVS